MDVQQLRLIFTAILSAKTEEEANKIINDSCILTGEVIQAVIPHAVSVTQAFLSAMFKVVGNNKEAIIMVAPTVLAILKDVKTEYSKVDQEHSDIDINIQADVNDVMKFGMPNVVRSVQTIMNEFKSPESKLTPAAIQADVVVICKDKEAKLDKELQQMIYVHSVRKAALSILSHKDGCELSNLNLADLADPCDLVADSSNHPYSFSSELSFIIDEAKKFIASVEFHEVKQTLGDRIDQANSATSVELKAEATLKQFEQDNLVRESNEVGAELATEIEAAEQADLKRDL
jgi:hypothetical protein